MKLHGLNKVNGPVTFICGCIEEWKNDEYVKDVAECGSVAYGVCGWCVWR